MHANYVYLISSLPMLRFGSHPPFSFPHFLGLCQRFISEGDFEILKSAGINGDYDYETRHAILKSWYEFDTALRDELAKARAAHRKTEADKYLRRMRYAPAAITTLALNAHRNPSLIEAEKSLDQEKWQMLEGLNYGHYFDLDFLLIYALKLLILERWERINSADKAQLIEEALA